MAIRTKAIIAACAALACLSNSALTQEDDTPMIQMGNGESNSITLDGLKRDGDTLTVSEVMIAEDGWLVMRGVLRNGEEVNLWDFDEPLPLDKPPVVSATYKTQRWRKYLDNLTTEPFGLHRIYFVNWLHKR